MEIRISFSNVVGKRLALGYTHFYSDDREPETVGGGGGIRGGNGVCTKTLEKRESPNRLHSSAVNY